VIVHRAFAWDENAKPRQRGGALWFPRALQGDGRHDNPERYGCLYATQDAVSAVVEQVARFVGNAFAPGMLMLAGLPIALATIELPDDVEVVDLDDPATLVREGLRPSHVATRERARTQRNARELFDAHPDAGALKWWSTFEASWTNVTLFDRAADRLRVRATERLAPESEPVQDAREMLGLS
jgi:RES domain-containing protein